MQIKYLSLCLLALGLSACSQHAIKSNTQTGQSLEQKAVSGLNAMYETSGYDYQGKLNIQTKSAEKAKTAQAEAKLDPMLQTQVEHYLKTQKINLDKKEKQHLYAALAKEQAKHDPYATTAGYSNKFDQLALNILSNIEFSYNGSVHYRQKLASFNLEAKYEKPTLLVHAKVPMVVDFNESKFYINYFSLMPYLVNKDSQTSFAYIDFSKYKTQINRVDFQKLADYLKQLNALYYVLAEPNKIQALALNAKDKQLGVVEKIRLNTTVEQLQLQMALYEQVNRPYFFNTVLGVNEKELAAEIAAALQTSQGSTQSAITADSEKNLSNDPIKASLRLSQLIDEHFNQLGRTTSVTQLSEDEDYTDVAADAVASATEAAALPTVKTVESQSTESLDDAQCQQAIKQPKNATVGTLTFCKQAYGLNAFASQDAEIDQLKQISQVEALSRLTPIFEPYVSEQLVDVKTFATLWAKHQPEIQQALKTNMQHIPLMIDVGLDAKGRASLVDYDLQVISKKYGTINVQADMIVQNYGKATTIDRAQLRQAKSLAEISKGSAIENMFRSLSAETDTDSTAKGETVLSLDAQLKQLAEKTYQQTHSYSKIYQALWGMQMATQNSALLKNYDAQSLQEMALVYAYWFSDEAVYNPTGKELKQIEALQKKHDLETEEQFDYVLGQAVYRMTLDAIDQGAAHQAWQKMIKQYKQPKVIFAQQYIQSFKQDYEVKQPQKLQATAEILAQAYVDSTQNRLSSKSIEKLTLEHEPFVDLELYQQTYIGLNENLKIKP